MVAAESLLLKVFARVRGTRATRWRAMLKSRRQVVPMSESISERAEMPPLLLRLPRPTMTTTSARSIAGSSEPTRLPLQGESAHPQHQEEKTAQQKEPSFFSPPDPIDPRIDPILFPRRDISSGATRSSTRRGTVSRAEHRGRGGARGPRRRGSSWRAAGGEEGNAARRAGTGSRAVVLRDRLLPKEWRFQVDQNTSSLFGAVLSGGRWRPSEAYHRSFGAVQRPARTGIAAR